MTREQKIECIVLNMDSWDADDVLEYAMGEMRDNFSALDSDEVDEEFLNTFPNGQLPNWIRDYGTEYGGDK